MRHASTAVVPRGASEATMMKQPWLEAVMQHAWAQQLWYTQAVLWPFLRKKSHIVHLHLPTVLLHRGTAAYCKILRLYVTVIAFAVIRVISAVFLKAGLWRSFGQSCGGGDLVFISGIALVLHHLVSKMFASVGGGDLLNIHFSVVQVFLEAWNIQFQAS